VYNDVIRWQNQSMNACYLSQFLLLARDADFVKTAKLEITKRSPLRSRPMQYASQYQPQALVAAHLEKPFLVLRFPTRKNGKIFNLKN